MTGRQMQLARRTLETRGPARRGQGSEGVCTARECADLDVRIAHLDAAFLRAGSLADEQRRAVCAHALQVVWSAHLEAPVPAQCPGEIIEDRPTLVIEVEPHGAAQAQAVLIVVGQSASALED